VYRGVTGYYLLAQDLWRLNRLRWNAETSMLKTLPASQEGCQFPADDKGKEI